jgi:hypothetical protein
MISVWELRSMRDAGLVFLLHFLFFFFSFTFMTLLVSGSGFLKMGKAGGQTLLESG